MNLYSGSNTRLLLFSLILLTAGFRIVRLTADPPSNFSWSGGYFADEGYWSHNARNEVLFGIPVLDQWNARAMSPVFAWIQLWIFRIFGVGLAQVRLIGILSSVLLSVSSFFLFRKQFNPAQSYLMALLVSLNYPMLVLGRQGILDPFAGAMAWTALLLLLSQSSLAAFLAGVLFIVSCTTKYLMIYAFVPLAFVLWPAFRERSVLRSSILCITAAILLLTVWFFLNYLPHQDLMGMYGRYYSSQQSWQPAEVVKNIVTQPFFLYFVKSPSVLFFGNLMLWYFLGNFRSAGKVERLCWLWLVSGILFFSLWKYRPERYYTSLLPPLAGLAGMGLLRIRDLTGAFASPRMRALLLLGMSVPAIQLLFLLCDAWFGWNFVPEQARVQSLDAILFLLLTAAVIVILVKRPKPGAVLICDAGVPARDGGHGGPPPKLGQYPEPKWMMIAFGLAFLMGDLRSFVAWAADPPYQAIAVSHDLQRQVGDGVIAGQWAPEMCLENRVRVVPVWHGFVNSDDPIRKYGITHLLLWRYPPGDEVEKFKEWYPDDFKKFRKVKQYTIKDSEVVLFENITRMQRH